MSFSCHDSPTRGVLLLLEKSLLASRSDDWINWAFHTFASIYSNQIAQEMELFIVIELAAW